MLLRPHEKFALEGKQDILLVVDYKKLSGLFFYERILPIPPKYRRGTGRIKFYRTFGLWRAFIP